MEDTSFKESIKVGAPIWLLSDSAIFALYWSLNPVDVHLLSQSIGTKYPGLILSWLS